MLLCVVIIISRYYCYTFMMMMMRDTRTFGMILRDNRFEPFISASRMYLYYLYMKCDTVVCSYTLSHAFFFVQKFQTRKERF